jgi:hypothetical protein
MPVEGALRLRRAVRRGHLFKSAVTFQQCVSSTFRRLVFCHFTTLLISANWNSTSKRSPVQTAAMMNIKDNLCGPQSDAAVGLVAGQSNAPKMEVVTTALLVGVAQSLVGVAQSAMNAEKFPFFLARKCPLRHCD